MGVELSTDHLGEFFRGVIASLKTLQDFEEDQIDLFTLEYQLGFEDCLVGSIEVESMRAWIIDLFESQGTYEIKWTLEEKNEFTQSFFPEIKEAIKESFIHQVKRHLEKIKPISLEISNSSWFYCPKCIDGINAQEQFTYFIKFRGEEFLYLFCPRCFLPMQSDEELGKKFKAAQILLGNFIHQNNLKILIDFNKLK